MYRVAPRHLSPHPHPRRLVRDHWSKGYESGHPLLDHHHRVILKLINLLSFSLKTGQEDLATDILAEVKRGMLWHFRVEKQIRERIGGGAKSGPPEDPIAAVWDAGMVTVDISTVQRIRRLWCNHILADKDCGIYS